MKRIKVKTNLLTFIFLFLMTSTVWSGERQVDYEGFILWLDCDKKGASRFEYSLREDTGNEKRLNKYTRDPNLGECQQLSTRSYRKDTPDHDRGHLVAFNHMDYSVESATDSNQMANILPQTTTLNKGAWLRTEKITECYREFGTLEIIGGAIWDSNPRILKTHGVDIPDYFWKLIFREDDSIAWIMPNDDTATREALDTFIVSLQEIEKATGYELSDDLDKSTKPGASWGLDACDGIPKWRS
jgi:endonuclease G, mitochondrial